MRKFDDEFKQEAVRRIFDGEAAASVARDLGINVNLLYRWKKQIKMESTDLELENIELKKELRKVREERDILKKAALIFGEGR
jgi:transposase